MEGSGEKGALVKNPFKYTNTTLDHNCVKSRCMHVNPCAWYQTHTVVSGIGDPVKINLCTKESRTVESFKNSFVFRNLYVI